MSDSKKLVVTVAHGTNNDKSSVAFTIANAALSTGMEVAIFLTSDGVELSREKASDLTTVSPFKPLGELIEGFVQNGGVLWTCSLCFQHHGLDVEDTVEGNMVTGAGPMIDWIASGASTLSF